MKPIVLKADQDGKILITVDEIKKMVDDAYEDGYRDGRNSVASVTVTQPYVPAQPWYTTVTCDAITLNSSRATL